MNREADIGWTSEPNMPENDTKPKRKAPGLDDPFEYAPRKPDGDLWAILLKPEMEADKIRCDGWKDEVQNLLIFAGLFSAVVTAFVIESYKFLQPDPNDTIIRLLSQIANGPNTLPSPLSASASISMASSFVHTPSSVRINVFWFISLILSLTTVLVGTIALQWLREHQSYPVFSPKETLAILHMRTEALEAWYVPQIFAALPLLLQGALVLFLTGLIDFTLPLGTGLTIPIAFVVSLTLLFLISTTTLPAFQSLFLLSGRFSRNAVPTPCAFKSPQSQVFRTVFRIFLHLISLMLSGIYLREASDEYCANMLPDDSDSRHLFPHIYTIWHRKTWPTFDSQWLSLRDAWHNGTLDKDANLYEHRLEWKDVFPLSDITQCLVKTTTGPTSAKHTEEYLVAACYCFEEISASVWKYNPAKIDNETDRRNNYFEQLYQRHSPPVFSISKFLIHNGQYKSNAPPADMDAANLYFRKHGTLFCLDHVCLFLDMLLAARTSTLAIEHYRVEIQSRVVRNLLMSDIKPLAPTPNMISSPVIPTCFSFYLYGGGFTNSSDYLVDIFNTTFETVASGCYNEDDQLINPLYTNIQAMPMLLASMADAIFGELQDAFDPETPNLQSLYGIGEKYSPAFRSAAMHLDNELTTSEMLTPSLLFEFSAMFLQRFLFWFVVDPENAIPQDTSFSRSLDMLLDSVTTYKQQMADRSKQPGKTRFGENELMTVWDAEGVKSFYALRFSDKWWSAFFLNYNNSGLFSVKTGSTVTFSTPFDIASRPLTSTSDETYAPVPSTASSSPLNTSLPIHSKHSKDMDNPSSRRSHASHVPHILLDVLPPGQAVESPTGADTQLLSSTTPSQSELPIRSDDPPDNPKTSGDSIIDIRPPS